MRFHIRLFKSEKSMRAVVTGGIGGVVDTFGKSLKYATCFGKLTAIKIVGTGRGGSVKHKNQRPRTSSPRSFDRSRYPKVQNRFLFPGKWFEFGII